MGVAIFVIVFVVSAVICHQLAARWGMKPVFWGVLGFLLGPFAVPLVLIFRSASGEKR